MQKDQPPRRRLFRDKFGSLFTDWVSASNTLHSSKQKAVVYALTESRERHEYRSHPLETLISYAFLCARTGWASGFILTAPIDVFAFRLILSGLTLFSEYRLVV